MQYRIEINNFEGPLDLLLFFIKRDKIDVYDIPMAQITRDFIDYLKLLKSLELEIGSDFILFSSMLINIKSKMLLPKHQNDAEEIEDPRTELVSKILEYKRFKYIGTVLRDKLDKELLKYYRQHNFKDSEKNDAIDYPDLTIYSLMLSMSKYLKKHDEGQQIALVKNKANLKQQKEEIINLLIKNKELSFYSLIESKERIIVIVIFLSLLELINNNKILIYQKKNNDDILIKSA